MTTTAYIGIGSNDGSRLHNCKTALDLLNQGRIEVKRVSSWYETGALSPAGCASDQPDYINGVAQVTTELEAGELLSYLLALEVKMGRPATREKGQPRTIDLDLLLYGDSVIDQERLTVPHPQIGKRMFVLEPLCDIAPDAIEPRSGLTARQLAEACKRGSPQAVRQLGDDGC